MSDERNLSGGEWQSQTWGEIHQRNDEQERGKENQEEARKIRAGRSTPRSGTARKRGKKKHASTIEQSSDDFTRTSRRNTDPPQDSREGRRAAIAARTGTPTGEPDHRAQPLR